MKKEEYRTWRASADSMLLLLRGIRKCNPLPEEALF